METEEVVKLASARRLPLEQSCDDCGGVDGGRDHGHLLLAFFEGSRCLRLLAPWSEFDPAKRGLFC